MHYFSSDFCFFVEISWACYVNVCWCVSLLVLEDVHSSADVAVCASEGSPIMARTANMVIQDYFTCVEYTKVKHWTKLFRKQKVLCTLSALDRCFCSLYCQMHQNQHISCTSLVDCFWANWWNRHNDLSSWSPQEPTDSQVSLQGDLWYLHPSVLLVYTPQIMSVSIIQLCWWKPSQPSCHFWWRCHNQLNQL